jgi:non-ribosomal peptide synthetase component F
LREKEAQMIINTLTYLEESAAKYPEKIALIAPDSQVTYQIFIQQAQAVGSHLSTLLAGETNQPVVVLIDRNITSVISFMGVVYSGNFYAPIDLQLPLNRIKTMLNSLQARVILAAKSAGALISSLEFDGQVLYFEDAVLARCDENRLADIRRKAIDTDPLYLMFTSGSTGSPKGVLISHRSVIDLVEQFSDIFGFSSECIFGNQAPFDFDVSVKDIYNTLKNGASMHILPRVLFSFPADLIKYINAAQINTAIWATSAYVSSLTLRRLIKSFLLR